MTAPAGSAWPPGADSAQVPACPSIRGPPHIFASCPPASSNSEVPHRVPPPTSFVYPAPAGKPALSQKPRETPQGSSLGRLQAGPHCCPLPAGLRRSGGMASEGCR